MPLVVDELDVSLHTQASLALVELVLLAAYEPKWCTADCDRA